jgi:nucleoside diphosphate kinase
MALERTLILIKPDAVQRRLIGRVITRIEDKGLSIIGLKLLQVTPEISRLHYFIRSWNLSSRLVRWWLWRLRVLRRSR